MAGASACMLLLLLLPATAECGSLVGVDACAGLLPLTAAAAACRAEAAKGMEGAAVLLGWGAAIPGSQLLLLIALLLLLLLVLLAGVPWWLVAVLLGAPA